MNWYFDKDKAPEKWCDFDYVANWIVSENYTPETDLENVIVTIILHYESALEDEGQDFFAIQNNPNAPMINIDDVKEFVKASGGIKEFDYEA